MSSYIDTHGVIERDGLLVEVTLYKDQTIDLYTEAGTDDERRMSIDEARQVHAALGNLIWQADHP